jgi:hypothetical protein
MSNFLLGAIIGILAGLAYCYWHAIMTAYQNRDVIAAGGNVIQDVQNLVGAVRTKL